MAGRAWRAKTRLCGRAANEFVSPKVDISRRQPSLAANLFAVSLTRQIFKSQGAAFAGQKLTVTIHKPGALLFALSGALFCFPLIARAADTFGAQNAGGVSVKGLNREEAIRRLKRELAPKLDKKIQLRAGPANAIKTVTRRRADMGFNVNLGKMIARLERGDKYVPLFFRVDANVTQRALRRVQNGLNTSPVNARPVYYKKKVRIDSQHPGGRLNIGASAIAIRQRAEKDAAQTRFPLVRDAVAPKVTAQRLKGINAILATYTTDLNPNKKGRTTNVRVASQTIDGTVLKPGETFSLNDVVGERTPQRGYKKAIIFANRQLKTEYGGGVSQITGTLFNAALEAGLPILTYRVHTRPVNYISIGRDATVSWGSFDMKFKNNTGAPIFISYRLKGSELTARLFGKKTGNQVKIRVRSQRVGPREINAQLYRTIRRGGKVITKQRVGTSKYKWEKDENPDD